MSFNNPDWKPSNGVIVNNTSKSSAIPSTQKARPVRINDLPEGMEDKKFWIKIFVARSPFRGQQAFGSMTVDTELGALTMNGLAIKRDNKKNTITTQMPFKTYPNKREGGSWNVVTNEYGEVWQTVGPVSYTKFFDNDAAGVVSKLFYEAYCMCSTCNNCRDMEPTVVNKMIDRIAELNSMEKRTQQEDKELDKLTSQLATMNKTCYLDPADDEVSWFTKKEQDAEMISVGCTHYSKAKQNGAKANKEAASKLFNMSVDTKIEVPEETTETTSDDTEEELF
jgi:hypothetical protein